MRLLLVTERTRAGSDEVSRRETVLQGAEIRMGRGSPMEINLPEIDVDYHHATVVDDGGALRITAVGENGLTSGKKRVHDIVLAPGVTVRIDRFEFSAEPGRDGADHVLVMKVLPEVQSARVARREKRALVDVLPSRRLLSWVFAIAILGVFIIWPMSAVLTRTTPEKGEVVLSDRGKDEVRKPHPMEALWITGPLSKAHAEIGGECGSCHLRPFEKTTDAACLSCHATTENHITPAGHPQASLDGMQCSDCHKEHNGGESPVVSSASLCADCHADIVAVAPETKLRPISTFLSDHPNFEPEIITAVERGDDGKLHPVLLPKPFPKDAVLEEISGLRFPHDKHLAKDGVALISGKQPLACNDCHQVEADGNLMRPIRMERDCGGCHQMAFAPAGTAISLPHADEAGIAKIVHDYFFERVAEGEVELPAEKSSNRRRLGRRDRNLGGEALTEAWAAEESERQLDAIFGTTLCATCHEAQKVGDAATASGWLVQPALLQRQWMPRANFSHKRHEEMECTSCHAAPESKAATDVLMPQISTCRECHKIEAGREDPLLAYLGSLGAAEEAPLQSAPVGKKNAPVECVTCHGFHVEGKEPMSPAHAELYEAKNSGQ
ncbi:cytochrome c3 family protein [Rhodobacteraceae bacterium NNCM2]|nr:cytochrome c3 family protein [Coraliihabitans acroporae]